MSRLIDADELKTAFPCGEEVRTESVRATIDHAPTVTLQEKDEIIKGLERVIASKDGMIDGLKFALRCNGVSGGEVR